MEWILVTFSIYRRAFARAAVLAVRNWPVMATVFVYSFFLSVTGRVASQLGMAGGFLASFVWAACVSSFLYLVEMIVRTSKVTMDDFRNSFAAYLWDVIGISFLSWMFFSLATPALLQLPQGVLILLCIQLAAFVLFNAVPELIYLGHHSSFALLAESYAFISVNWIEWFPASIVAAILIYLLNSLELEGAAEIAQNAVLGLFIYFVMIMRGLLFIELFDSTHRGRLFKYRTGA
ncbi:MAG: hypothetical protein HY270_05960 [Deltaproteobacteria bacterium]|nr:hypothetical protein [Deltaproteobacteria bacterium]